MCVYIYIYLFIYLLIELFVLATSSTARGMPRQAWEAGIRRSVRGEKEGTA